MRLSNWILLNEELRITPCIERIWRETLSRNCGLIRGWPRRGQFLETRLRSLSPDRAFARNIFSEQDTYFVVSFVYLRLHLRIAVYRTNWRGFFRRSFLSLARTVEARKTVDRRKKREKVLRNAVQKSLITMKKKVRKSNAVWLTI